MYFVSKPNTDAINFFSAANITDTTQCIAVATLVTDLKNYNIWDKMKAIYPMVGQPGVSSSFEVNLKDPSTFRGTFYGGWIFANTGAKPNGTNGYMDTQLNVSTNLSLTNNHLSFYQVTNLTNTGYGTELTTNIPYVAPSVCGLKTQNSTLSPSAGYSIGQDGGAIYSNTNGQGFSIGISTSISLRKVFLNNEVKATSTSDNTGTLPNGNLCIGGAPNGIATGIGVWSKNECAFASIGDGLTDTEAANFYTAVQRFQTTLGRQV